jgi:hypothetical protein
LPNGYFCHCDRPTLRPSCKNEAFLVVSFSHRTNHSSPIRAPKDIIRTPIRKSA